MGRKVAEKIVLQKVEKDPLAACCDMSSAIVLFRRQHISLIPGLENLFLHPANNNNSSKKGYNKRFELSEHFF